MIKKILKFILIAIATLLVVTIIYLAFQTPSHDREWGRGHEELPLISIEDNLITIENMRDFEWTGPFEAEPTYITDTFKLDEMEKVEVIISHFAEYEGMAHIFLSFGFVDGRHVNISLESRREADEKFSPFWGLLRKFEIIYVVGTDRDLLGVRTDHRDERVYVYPTIVSSPEKVRELFLTIAADINDVYENPRFYNTLAHNCTNELTRKVESISELDFPLTYKSLLPGFFDEVLYKMQLLPNTESFATLKESSLVNNDTVDAASPEYSVQIRKHLE
jgi:hypothetical protein